MNPEVTRDPFLFSILEWKITHFVGQAGIGYTHIIGNGELVSTGRGAGIQTWAHQRDRVRLVARPLIVVLLPGQSGARAGPGPSELSGP